MSRPRLLDLFCGAGGAARGYQRAGFYVVGIDNRPQPHYAGDEFVLADALTFPLLAPLTMSGFDAIHASPPCQLFSRAGKLREAQGGTSSSLDLLTPIRPLIVATGLPYIIENVVGAPLEGVFLCGSAFGLGVRRHRIFESDLLLLGAHCRHREQGRPVGVYHVPGDDIPKGGKTARDVPEAQAAMGIDWMPEWNELKEAIPPAYTEHIGRQLMGYVESVAA